MIYITNLNFAAIQWNFNVPFKIENWIPDAVMWGLRVNLTLETLMRKRRSVIRFACKFDIKRIVYSKGFVRMVPEWKLSLLAAFIRPKSHTLALSRVLSFCASKTSSYSGISAQPFSGGWKPTEGGWERKGSIYSYEPTPTPQAVYAHVLYMYMIDFLLPNLRSFGNLHGGHIWLSYGSFSVWCFRISRPYLWWFNADGARELQRTASICIQTTL